MKINKIGLDLHGVISDMPEFFRLMAGILVAQKWEIHIVTGGSIEKSLKELKELHFIKNLNYTHLFSVLDYLDKSDIEPTGTHPTMGNNEYPNEVWDSAKAKYCEENNIDLMIDDSMVYLKHFTTPFARLWTKTGTPKINKPKRMLQ